MALNKLAQKIAYGH